MHETLNGTVEVSLGGGTWFQVPGVSQLSFTGGKAPTRQRRDFGGIRKLVGRPSIHGVSITLPAVRVGDPSYGVLHNAYANLGELNVRARYPQRLLAVSRNNAQVQLQGSNGSATFSQHGEHVDFTQSHIRVGDAILTNNNEVWAITAIRGAQDVDVSGPTASFGPGTYSVVRPGITTDAVPCYVTGFNGINADANSVVGMSVEMTPVSAIGALRLWAST